MPDHENDLLKLLDIERAALVRADFSTVDKNARRKEELIQDLADKPISVLQLQKVRHALAQNQTLFGAAIAGLGAARSRIKTLKDVQNNLRTYDQAGQISDVKSNTSDVNKRS